MKKIHDNIAYALFAETGPNGVIDPTCVYKTIRRGKVSTNIKTIRYKGKDWWVNVEEYQLINYFLDKFKQVSRRYSESNGTRTYIYEAK